QVPPFGLLRRVKAKPARQPVPSLRIERDARVTPEVPPDLGRHLEDDELICPGREPALTPELPKLAGDGDQRVAGRLIHQTIKRRPGELHPRAAPPDLTPCNPQQHLMQPSQRRLPARAAASERPQPLR